MRAGLSTLILLVCSAGCVVEQPAGTGTRNGASSPDSPAAVGAGAKLQAYMSGVAQGLGPEAREALKKVDGDSRRLLALRGYLRGGRDLGAKWAWSEEQINSYKGSAEYAAAVAEVEKVRGKFAELNPGYTLQVNTEVRSLDEQVRKWNEADSVHRIGDEILSTAHQELAGPKYRAAPDKAGLQAFERFIRDYGRAGPPTVAVPGLSAHGQLRAFDFQVRRADKVIAGTSQARASQEWDEAGWTTRLSEAVSQASTRFTGPLRSPYEPWHYTYTP